MIEKISFRINETIEALEKSRTLDKQIEKASLAIIECFKNGGKLLIAGNGGSAADAQHIAAEMEGKFYKLERKALPAIALSCNTSSVTAIGNDFGYDLTFRRSVEAFGQDGDCFLGISTSGNSENVVLAMELAREKGLKTIALTGEGGGKLKNIADIAIAVESKNTPIIQNCHITIAHIICELVENAF